MSFSANTTRADCSEVVKDCKAALSACDTALEQKNKSLELADLTIHKCIARGTEVQYQLNETQKELDAWYRNPFIIGAGGILLGLVGGFVISQKVTR